MLRPTIDSSERLLFSRRGSHREDDMDEPGTGRTVFLFRPVEEGLKKKKGKKKHKGKKHKNKHKEKKKKR